MTAIINATAALKDHLRANPEHAAAVDEMARDIYAWLDENGLGQQWSSRVVALNAFSLTSDIQPGYYSDAVSPEPASTLNETLRRAASPDEQAKDPTVSLRAYIRQNYEGAIANIVKGSVEGAVAHLEKPSEGDRPAFAQYWDVKVELAKEIKVLLAREVVMKRINPMIGQSLDAASNAPQPALA